MVHKLIYELLNRRKCDREEVYKDEYNSIFRCKPKVFQDGQCFWLGSEVQKYTLDFEPLDMRWLISNFVTGKPVAPTKLVNHTEHSLLANEATLPCPTEPLRTVVQACFSQDYKYPIGSENQCDIFCWLKGGDFLRKRKGKITSHYF